MDTGALITIDPEVQGGTPCFAGTRVPVRSLFDAIKHGRTIDYFLKQFPTVRPEQVRAILDRASAMLAATGHHEDTVFDPTRPSSSRAEALFEPEPQRRGQTRREVTEKGHELCGP